MRARRNGVAGLVLAAVAACAPAPARAWGDEGHRIIALVAYRHLTPAVRAKVDQLLAGGRRHAHRAGYRQPGDLGRQVPRQRPAHLATALPADPRVAFRRH